MIEAPRVDAHVRRGSYAAFAFAAALLVSLPWAQASDAAPQAPAIQPGEYVTEAGWGRLLVTQNPGGAASFAIQSISGEDYCELKGEIHDGAGIAREGTNTCSVSFTGKGGAIDIAASTAEECKHFCGYNGGFEATYLKVAKGCGEEEIARTREAFKHLYQHKQYRPALSRLSPVLENCLSTLTWEEEGDIRNDLAIAQYRNGLHGQCLVTLQKYAADARLDDDEVADSWTQLMADRYKAIVRAARTNIGLCSRSTRD